MGMFDSIYIDEVKCPYCGEIKTRECQTKELDCELKEYRKGDSIGTTEYNELECITSCSSDECREYERKQYGYPGQRAFDVIVRIKNGIVTGEWKPYTPYTINK